MKRQIIALAFAAAAAFSSQAPASAADLELLQPGKLLVATEGTFPPFSMRAADGSLDGLEIRVMKEISKRLGLEYTPVIIKWESLLIGLQADQYDITSDAMDITAERQKQVVFADGWLESGAAVVVPKGSPIKTPADLKGKSVGALASSTFAKLAEDKGATVKAYKAETDGIQDLLNGNIDAEITDAIGAGYMIKSANMPLEVLPEAISHIQKGFAVKKGKPELVKAVNKALAEMVADGSYAKLTTDLVGFDPAPKNPIKTVE